MDVDFLNTAAENQMDLMAMMSHIDKLADFCEPPPPAPFHNAASASASPPSHLLGFPTPAPMPTAGFYHDHCGNFSHADIANASIVSAGDMSGGNRQASMEAMREMIFRIAVMQPVHIDPESVKPPKRRNVKISRDPQSVAARHRRERISERIRILQRLVPGGTKMDTASMLDEAIHYVKFLKTQVRSLERAQASRSMGGFAAGAGFPGAGYAYQDFMNNNNTQMMN